MSAPKRRDADGAEPRGERDGRDGDDPAAGLVARADERCDGCGYERGGEPAEESAEGTPLHRRRLWAQEGAGKARATITPHDTGA